jgi:hypothetical protein
VVFKNIHLSGAGSYEQSPRLLEAYGADGADSDGSAGPGETQLREDLADAMMESPGVPTRDTGNNFIFLFFVLGSMKRLSRNCALLIDMQLYVQHVLI